MKISIEKLGALKQAEFTLGDLTIICGENNTGKTYATHATYGFLDYLRSNAEFPVERDDIDRLFTEGSVDIDLTPYIDKLQNHLDRAAKNYSKIMHRVFAGNETLFNDSTLYFNLVEGREIQTAAVQMRVGSAERSVLNIQGTEGGKKISVSLIVDRDGDETPHRDLVENMISNGIGLALLGKLIPKPFLASAERTGAAIFQKELDFTKNRLVEMLGDKTTKLHPFQFLSKFSGEYPIAVRKNVDFIRELPSITNKESFIAKEHPAILESFKDIIGGEYKVSKDGEIQYIPNGNKRARLSLVESSSAVRSLLDIGFYLRHNASKGDLLMIDEPELNLHPENQRRVARLLARLVNIGIKVFITTHSDYIIKELNTLLMLNHGGDRLKAFAEQEAYLESELLDTERVRAYIAEAASILLKGKTRKSTCQTLVPAEIDDRFGIEARSFDQTIEDMNRIQDEIIWGGDE